jgi:hypothetical protein
MFFDIVERGRDAQAAVLSGADRDAHLGEELFLSIPNA